MLPFRPKQLASEILVFIHLWDRVRFTLSTRIFSSAIFSQFLLDFEFSKNVKCIVTKPPRTYKKWGVFAIWVKGRNSKEMGPASKASGGTVPPPPTHTWVGRRSCGDQAQGWYGENSETWEEKEIKKISCQFFYQYSRRGYCSNIIFLKH